MNGKRLSRRDFIRLSALAAAGAALASCGPQPATQTAPQPGEATPEPAATTQSAPPPDEVEIRWLDWSDQDDIVNATIATFKERYPHVTVNFEPIGDAWGEKQLAQMVSGTAPDILTSFDETSYLWAEKEQLLDLNPLVDADLSPEQVNDFFNYHWVGLVHPESGIRMGLPAYAWFYQWYYNKEAFDEAGLAYPDENWTVDDYDTALEKLTKRDADGNVVRWGGIEACYDKFRIQLWLRTFGGHMVDPEDWTHCVLASEESQAALEWHRHRIWDTNTLAQVFQVVGEGSTLGLDPLATGKAAIMGQGSGDIAALFQNPPGFEWGVTIPPIGPTGERAGMGTIDNWGIWKGTKSPDIAWEFLKLLAVEDAFVIAATAWWGTAPNRKSLLPQFKQIILDQYPGVALDEHLDPQIQQLSADYIRVGEQFKRNKESSELITPVLEKIFVVGDSPVSIVEAVAEEVTAINQEG